MALMSTRLLLIVSTTTSTILFSDSTARCTTIPFRPHLSATSWVFLCDSTLLVLDSTTGAVKVSETLSGAIQCAAPIPASSQTGDSIFVFLAHYTVYILSPTSLNALRVLPDPLQSPTFRGLCSSASVGPSPSADGHSHAAAVYFSFQPYISGYQGNVVAVDISTGVVIAQASGISEPFGPVVVDSASRRLFVASTGSTALQGYWTALPVGMPSYSVALSSTIPMQFSIAYNATNRSAYCIAQNTLYTVDWKGNARLLAGFEMYLAKTQPIILGKFLVMIDSYFNHLFVFDSQTMELDHVSVCALDETVAPQIVGTKIIVFCSVQNSYATPAAQLVDISATVLKADASFVTTGSNYPPGLGGVAVGDLFVVVTSSSELRCFNISASPIQDATVVWTVTGGASYGFSQITSAPVALGGDVYFTALSSSGGSDRVQLFRLRTASGSFTPVWTLVVNSDTSRRQLIAISGGIFGSGMLYAINDNDIVGFAVNETYVDLKFDYVHSSGNIFTASQNNPVVLEPSAAICFFDASGHFNVMDGDSGLLAWRHGPVSRQKLLYPVLIDGSTVYFTDGQAVVGANIWSGAMASVSAYLDGRTRGFAVASSGSSTTIIGVTSDAVVFATQVPCCLAPGHFAPEQNVESPTRDPSVTKSLPLIDPTPGDAAGNAAPPSLSNAALYGIIGGLAGAVIVVFVVAFLCWTTRYRPGHTRDPPKRGASETAPPVALQDVAVFEEMVEADIIRSSIPGCDVDQNWNQLKMC